MRNTGMGVSFRKETNKEQKNQILTNITVEILEDYFQTPQTSFSKLKRLDL